MALSFTAVTGGNFALAHLRARTFTITFDDNYPNNGEAVTAANVGLKKILFAIPHGPARAADGSVAVVTAYDHTNSKVIAFESGADGAVLPEKGDTESLDGYVQRWTFLGW